MRISIKVKLIAVFSFLVLISAFIGLNSYYQVSQTANLVYTTYDNTLMAGQFAQAVKYDISNYNNIIQQALLARDIKTFRQLEKKIERAYKTLLEDLDVVKERSLSLKKDELLSAIEKDLDRVEALRKNILEKKISLLKSGGRKSFDLYQNWVSDKTVKSIIKDAEKIFDDSAENGYIFRLDSEELINKNLKQSTLATSLGIGLSIIFSFFVAFLIIKPLRRLEKVCVRVKEGNYSERSSLKNTDEFGDLSDSFNIMLDNIETKDKGMRTLLGSLPFGLFYIDEKGLISAERSPKTDEIVPNMESLAHMSDVYSALSVTDVRVMDVIETAFSGLLGFDSAMRLLPDRIDVDDKNLDISFKPINDESGSLLRIIVIIKDITDLVASQKKAKLLENQVKRVSFVSSDISGYRGFVKETIGLFNGFLQVDSLESKLRDLHSIKGLLSLNKFDSTADLVHHFESDFPSLEQDEISSRLKEIKNDFDDVRSEVDSILRLEKDEDGLYCNPEKINELIKHPSLSEECKTIAMTLEHFSVEEKFEKYKQFINSMAQEFEDKDMTLEINVPFDMNLHTLKKLDLSFSHILRNIVDHGIENRATRKDCSKDEVGHIRVKGTETSEAYKFTISDDGQGINGDVLFNKAVERGILNGDVEMSEQEKINLIFVPGLSVKEDVSDISGRGLGMDAVKDSIEKLGGRITVTSKLEEGTTFDFFIKKESNENFIF